MHADIDHDSLNDALQRCGASWTAAQTHGLQSSRLAVTGTSGLSESIGQVLDGASVSNEFRKECEDMLDTLWHTTRMALSGRMSAFQPLLPDDSDRADVRTEGLAHWCEGYLHGLVCAEHDATIKERLAAEPVADVIKDMLQITRATVNENGDDESNEDAYVEIVEYLRVAAQLVYEELAEVRPGQLQ